MFVGGVVVEDDVDRLVGCNLALDSVEKADEFWLIIGQVLAVNPAHAVRGPKHVVRRGKTPVLTEEQARRLLDSINTSTVVGLRDRALIGVMIYSFARIGAVVARKVEDYYASGKRWWLRLHEKGGKRMKCRRTTSSKHTSTSTWSR
jgi:site-specific recombinase XerC